MDGSGDTTMRDVNETPNEAQPDAPPSHPTAVSNEISTDATEATKKEVKTEINSDSIALTEKSGEADEANDEVLENGEAGEIIENDNNTIPPTVKEDSESITKESAPSKKEEEAESANESAVFTKETVVESAPTSASAVEKVGDDKKSKTDSSSAAVKEEQNKEEVDSAMDVESSDANEPDPTPAPESPKASAEIFTSASGNNNNHTTTYSTRGRSTEASFIDEASDRIHIRDALEESPRPKDPSSAVSFLVEAMTEEERRTRTRFLPEVDGMHMLRKNEIKDDLSLARSLPSIVSPSGVLQTRTGRLSGAGRNGDSMDVDGEETSHDFHDEDAKTIDLPSSSLRIPSDTFVAPKGVVVGESESTIVVKEIEQNVPSPSKVESVTSFNPPRPPESVGGKKKHRMIRWERRPEDIEVDMKNYRRTVQRTRQELQKSEGEYERLEMIDAHLRRHFLNHCELIDKEYEKLNDEMEAEVDKLIKESELIGSRTRSRNLSKVDVVMRDVLTMLTRNEQKDESMDRTPNTAPSNCNILPGFGGLNNEAFTDWERSTDFKSMKPCISWIEPGVKVKTSYGEGVVVEVLPPEVPKSSNKLENTTMAKKTENRSEKEPKCMPVKQKYESLLPLRVKVRMEYGVGVFVASAIQKMESPSHFTDAQLAKRWRGMIESALKVGPCIDLQGMLPSGTKNGRLGANGDSGSLDEDGDEWLPTGAALIPTKTGRGNILDKMDLRDIEESLQDALYDGHGILGRKSNPGVTEEIRSWEDDEQEYLNLRASILQLKNKLYRQRRIRVLNERTTASMNDRYLRAEELVSEMRSDLKSLKRRLEDELRELGITEAMANKILFKFYQGHQEEDHGDGLTPRRLRRASSMIGEMLPEIERGSDSMDDQGTDDLSGDDLDSQRPAKRVRAGE